MSNTAFTDRLWVVFENSRAHLSAQEFNDDNGRFSDLAWQMNKVERTGNSQIDYARTSRGDLCIAFSNVSRPSLETFFKDKNNHPAGYTPRLTETNPIERALEAA